MPWHGKTVPGHSLWAGIQERLSPARSRDGTTVLPVSFTLRSLPALSQEASQPQTSLQFMQYTPFHAIKQQFLWAAAQLYVCSDSIGWEKKKRKHLCVNTNVLGPQGHQMGDQDQALCSMDIASLCPWQFLALFT